MRVSHQDLRALFPNQSLFTGHSFHLTPSPLPISLSLGKELELMARVLLRFYKAVSLLYRYSIEGTQPRWVAEWLERGKPKELIELQRSEHLRGRIPSVIRPDVILCADSAGKIAPKIVELDSVPGGIGLTAFFNQIYSNLGFKVLGGKTGMLSGFASIFGSASKVHIIVSKECATYLPEMQWLCEQLNRGEASDRFQIQNESFSNPSKGEAVYRFFELFDLNNIPGAWQLFSRTNIKRKDLPLLLTPPPRTIFEEKMLSALVWNSNLTSFWIRSLGDKFFRKLKSWFPESWVIVPGEIPPFAGIPGLNITNWSALKHMSQRERALVIKVSGFSEIGWGSRSVTIGSDSSLSEWSDAVDDALASFHSNPYVLQRFHKPAVIETQQFDSDTGEVKNTQGKVRLCPYIFISGEEEKARPTLSGVLATICPVDKKIIHGMKDAALTCVQLSNS